MRFLPALLIAAALPLAACQVTEDKNNGAVSVSYNEDVAANTAADVASTAENVANSVGNGAERAAAKVNNEVGKVDIDIKRKENPAPVTNSQ